MEKTNKPRYHRMKLILLFIAPVIFLSVVAIPNKNKKPVNLTASSINDKGNKKTDYKVNDINSDKIAAGKKREEESKAAFNEAYRVFMHPRCLNCHPAGDTPFQGDAGLLHTQGVKRGPDGKGLYAMKCKNCHQDTNIPGEHMPPGHPNWHLPPAHRKMVFEGKSPRQLAMSFKDPKFTGFKTMAQFIEHVEKDPLVMHSFTYGTRPPLSHEEFAAKVKEWVEKGAVLPDK
ncbi:MAG TPA: hypothetical protein VJU78_20685 [Chitinophagaceae bacterium]|nr:hypothetical protein [Chitinophagaceae bacterium]